LGNGRVLRATRRWKGSISFLKKRNKKLFLFAPSRRFKWANQVLPRTDKSFLVLLGLPADDAYGVVMPEIRQPSSVLPTILAPLVIEIVGRLPANT
jgi:hypothetical protein